MAACGGGRPSGSAEPGGGATTPALCLLAAASAAGSWCLVVGLPDLGLAAADEAGIQPDRLTLARCPVGGHGGRGHREHRPGAPGPAPSVEGGPCLAASAWAEPWLSVERWWRPSPHRAAWVQVVLATGAAHLLRSDRGQWRFAATYD